MDFVVRHSHTDHSNAAATFDHWITKRLFPHSNLETHHQGEKAASASGCVALEEPAPAIESLALCCTRLASLPRIGETPVEHAAESCAGDLDPGTFRTNLLTRSLVLHTLYDGHARNHAPAIPKVRNHL